jgi:hypothetical protein
VNRTRLTSCFHPNTTQSGAGSTLTPSVAFPVHDRVQFKSTRQPAESNRGRLIPTKKRNPCVICGDTSGDCREKQYDELRLCAHQGDLLRLKESVLGADGGRWTLFKRADRWNAFAPSKDRNATVQAIQPTFISKPSVTRLSVEQRHQAFTLLAKRLSLQTDDAADLLRRGFTADQIHQIGAKTLRQGQRFPEAPLGLPGFENRRFTSATGYIVFTRDWNGQITGGQIRPRGEKYRWLQNCQLPSGELPLQVLKGDPTKPVFVIEGIGAKPWWVHLQTGATVIGIAGGCWNSPFQIEQLLQVTQGQQWILLPDGDSIYNQHVLNSYLAFSRLVPDLQIRWWNQFYKGQDADETTAWQDGTDIPSTEFFDPDRLSLLQARGWMFFLDRQPDISINARFLPSGLVANCTQRLVGVIAGLGTGKTESQKEVVAHAKLADRPVIALSTLRRLSQQQGNRIGVPYFEEGRTDDLGSDVDRSFGLAYRRKVGFACCTASLRKSSALQFDPDDFKGAVVILDEWDTILSDLITNQTTDIAKHRVEVETALVALLQNAHQVFVLSGTLKQVDIDWIEGRMGERMHLIQNTFKPAANRRLTSCTREALLRSHLYTNLNSGSSVLVHTSDQKDSPWAAGKVAGSALAMCPALGKEQVEFLDGESTRSGSDRQKRLARDPNAVLPTLKLAALSPAVNTGVDITVRDHFDAVYVFSRGHLSVSDVIQVGGRLRDDTRRLLFVPSKVPAAGFGGETFWRRIRDNVQQHVRQFANEAAVSALVGTVLADDPGFIYAAKLYALRNQQALHYRQLITEGFERQGYTLETIDREPTPLEKQTTQKQKEHVTRLNDNEAIAIASAPMPSDDDADISPASRQKAETVRIFGVDPDDLTAFHIQNHDKALRGLRNRFLYADPTAAAMHSLQRIEARAPGGDLSKVHPFDISILTAAKRRMDWIRDLLVRANATDLLTYADSFSHRDPMVQRIHRAVLEDPAAKEFIGSQHTSFKDAIGVVQSILSVFGLGTQSKLGSRSEGRVRQYRITDALQPYNPRQVLAHWQQNPEVLLQEPSADAGGADYP